MIEVGRSSMVIEIKCYNKKPNEREFHPCHVGFVTMVAVDADGEPVRSIPPLSYDTPAGREVKALAAHRLAQLAERRDSLEWIDQEEHFQVSDVVDPDTETRYDIIKPEQSEVRIKGQIISQNPQMDGRIRAGDLLVWLDRVATYTARHFTRNDHAVTLSINDVIFKKPLHSTDRIELISRVVYVRTHTLEGAIDIIVHTLEGVKDQLDTVEFFILNYYPSGAKRKITTGLKLGNEDQDSLRWYLKARTRHAFWKSHPESHLTQSLE